MATSTPFTPFSGEVPRSHTWTEASKRLYPGCMGSKESALKFSATATCSTLDSLPGGGNLDMFMQGTVDSLPSFTTLTRDELMEMPKGFRDESDVEASSEDEAQDRQLHPQAMVGRFRFHQRLGERLPAIPSGNSDNDSSSICSDISDQHSVTQLVRSACPTRDSLPKIDDVSDEEPDELSDVSGDILEQVPEEIECFDDYEEGEEYYDNGIVCCERKEDENTKLVPSFEEDVAIASSAIQERYEKGDAEVAFEDSIQVDAQLGATSVRESITVLQDLSVCDRKWLSNHSESSGTTRAPSTSASSSARCSLEEDQPLVLSFYQHKQDQTGHAEVAYENNVYAVAERATPTSQNSSCEDDFGPGYSSSSGSLLAPGSSSPKSPLSTVDEERLSYCSMPSYSTDEDTSKADAKAKWLERKKAKKAKAKANKRPSYGELLKKQSHEAAKRVFVESAVIDPLPVPPPDPWVSCNPELRRCVPFGEKLESIPSFDGSFTSSPESTGRYSPNTLKVMSPVLFEEDFVHDGKVDETDSDEATGEREAQLAGYLDRIARFRSARWDAGHRGKTK